MSAMSRIATAALVLVLASEWTRGAEAVPNPAPPSAPFTRIDKPYEVADFSWVPRTLKQAPDLKSDKPHYTLWVLGTGEELKKSVMAMVLDESQGPGTGYDVLYVDLNFNGDLTEADERLMINKEIERHGRHFIAFKTKDAGGKQEYDFTIKLNGKAGVLGEWCSTYVVPGLYWVGALPGNVTLGWSTELQTAPVYRLGAPLWVYLSGKMPGSVVGTYKAGSSLVISLLCAAVGDSDKARLVAEAGLPAVLRVRGADGKLLEEITVGGGCRCGGNYALDLEIPGRVPPGTHELVARDVKNRTEYVYKVEIENPDYGKPLADPGYAALKARFPSASFASLREAANVPAELTKAYPEENVIPIGIRHVTLACNNLEGDHRGSPMLDANPFIWVGQYPKDGDLRPCLMHFDLSAIPPEAKILGAQLRLVLKVQIGFEHGPPGVTLAAAPLRREWHDKRQPEGFTCWYGPLISAQDGSKGVQWGQPGCNDPETDYFASLETAVDVGGYPDKATKEIRRVVSLDLGDMVKQWRAGEIPNNGIVLRLRGTTPQHRGPGGLLSIVSSNHPEGELRPALVIAYEGPAPQPQFAPMKAETCPVK
jgi:hypothetical protein